LHNEFEHEVPNGCLVHPYYQNIVAFVFKSIGSSIQLATNVRDARTKEQEVQENARIVIKKVY